MVFPFTHLYITARWQIAGQEEEGQFGLRTDQGLLPTPTAAAAMAADIKAFWDGAGGGAPISHQLFEVKFALVGPDGKYPAGVDPEVVAFDPPDAGGDTGTTLPLQVAHVCTLRTAKSRGIASRGRIYLPYLADSVDGTFHWPTVAITERLNLLTTMFNSLNTELDGQIVVMSKIGAGAFEPVTRIELGNRPDVQRRRAKGLVETYTGADLA